MRCFILFLFFKVPVSLELFSRKHYSNLTLINYINVVFSCARFSVHTLALMNSRVVTLPDSPSLGQSESFILVSEQRLTSPANATPSLNYNRLYKANGLATPRVAFSLYTKALFCMFEGNMTCLYYIIAFLSPVCISLLESSISDWLATLHAICTSPTWRMHGQFYPWRCFKVRNKVFLMCRPSGCCGIIKQEVEFRLEGCALEWHTSDFGFI